MNKEIEWFIFDSKGPKWKRSIGYDREENEFYMPAIYLGNEMLILTAIGYDGISAIYDKDHLYVPFTWAKEEIRDKKLSKELEILEERLRRENNYPAIERQDH